MNDPLISPEILPASSTPLWGMTAILGLMGLLGFVLFQRLTEEDQRWARWEKHELSGVVLGQSPDRDSESAPPARIQTQQNSVPPLWAQGQTSQSKQAGVSEAARGKNLANRASLQAEGTQNGGGDPFAEAIPARRVSIGEGHQNPGEATAPRRLFQDGAAAQESARPVRQSERGEMDLPAFAPAVPSGRTLEAGQTLEGQTGSPSTLGFAASPITRDSGEGREVRSARYQRIQQTAGTDEGAEVAFPEPSAIPQMPIQSIPPSGLPAGNQEEIPAMPAELNLDSTPISGGRPIPSQQRFPELDIADPQPTLSMPRESLPIQASPAQSSPAQSSPVQSSPVQNLRGIPSLENREMSPVQRSANGVTDFAPAEQPFSGSTRQNSSIQSQYNEPVPPGGMRRQPSDPQLGHQLSNQPVVPAAEAIPADEVYQVQSGDNYWTISRKFYSSARFFSALAEYNKHRIPVPEKMKPGMYVLVPHVEVLHQRYPQLTGGGPRDPAESAPAGFFIDENGQPCYRVGKGDTLTDIAQKYLGRSSRWVQIHGMNQDRLENGKILKIGSVLRLPADASQVVLVPADSEIR